ncbi:MAG: GTPase [Candidatus Parabeggiatoa sp. nov. 3]|jgi:uncharacterized protein (DUF697 family)|nr:MAG: GTPase [Gammaproteobacteria bacterium]RKZ56902.1 MAG: GTPase [Gammaproteobacteria bacterium]RKZ85211.1 MAG: GTPase [Gammaproteobacteria bacterium]
METESSQTDETPATPMEENLQQRVERADEAHEMVKQYTLGSIAIAAVPFPLVDLAAVTGLQVKMVHSIANHYEVPFSQTMVKSMIAALTGGALSATTATSITSLVKVVPFFGQIAGFLGGAVMFGATSYAIGKVFIEHFESGGTFLDFDPENMKAHFQQLFEEGQQFATQASK